MGILARFKDIMSSNINALLDKMEDPEKMIDQILRNLQSDLGEVKAETAGVMAEEARAKRELAECQAEVNKLQSYAEKAVMAGNDGDAAIFLQKKANKAQELTALQQIAVAKTQEKINKLGESVTTAKGTMSKFDAMEQKANAMLDKANAMAELQSASATDPMADLMDKYDSTVAPSVDDELAALKARLGKQ